MIAEDEPLVRMAAVAELCDSGFDVIEVGNAAEAVEILEKEAESVDVLFTDIQMPGSMNGLELVHHASVHWPNIKLMVASGRVCPLQGDMPPGCIYLPKPYPLPMVVAKILQLIAAK